MLNDQAILRYSRHVLLREVGGTGQEALLSACVDVASLDEGGRACAMWLARAGVGALTLPEDTSPAPDVDRAGLLLAGDAGLSLSQIVRERLRFHSPALEFRAIATHRVEARGDAATGTAAALRIVRTLVTRPSP